MADDKRDGKADLSRFLVTEATEQRAGPKVRPPPRRPISRTGADPKIGADPAAGHGTQDSNEGLPGLVSPPNAGATPAQREDDTPIERPRAPATAQKPEPIPQTTAPEPAETPAKKDWSAAIGKWARGVLRRIKWPLIIVGSLAVLGIGGKEYYNYHQKTKAEEAAALAKKKKEMAIESAKAERRKRVYKLYKKLRGCEDIKLLKQMCLDERSVELKNNSAALFAKANEFVKAGKIYAELGIVDKVSDMIRECEKTGDKKGAETIRREMRILLDARKMAFDALRERERKETEERKRNMKARIASVVQVLKKCGDRTRLARMCFTLEQENLKKQSAGSFIQLKRYEEAGIMFAKMNMLREAMGMINLCEREGNKKGAQRIRDELKITAEALNKIAESVGKIGAEAQQKDELKELKRMSEGMKGVNRNFRAIEGTLDAIDAKKKPSPKPDKNSLDGVRME